MVDLAKQNMLVRGEVAGATLGGDVELRGEVIQQLAVVIGDRTEQQAVPERRLVAPIVEQLDRQVLARGKRRPDPRHRGRIGVRPLEETAVSADDLRGGIAGLVEKCLVGEHDRVIGQLRIADHHRHPRPLDGDLGELAVVDPHRRRECRRRGLTQMGSGSGDSQGAPLGSISYNVAPR